MQQLFTKGNILLCPNHVLHRLKMQINLKLHDLICYFRHIYVFALYQLGRWDRIGYLSTFPDTALNNINTNIQSLVSSISIRYNQHNYSTNDNRKSPQLIQYQSYNHDRSNNYNVQRSSMQYHPFQCPCALFTIRSLRWIFWTVFIRWVLIKIRVAR